MSAYPFRSEPARARYLAYDARRGASWPVAARARRIPTSFGETFVRESGPTEGRPLLLLPGIGSSSLSFSANVGALSAHVRVCAIDNIHDHGLSAERAEHPVTSRDNFVVWLDELAAALGGGAPVDVAGLSYGGWIAAEHARRHPERVRRLVLLAPAGLLAPLPFGFVWRAVLTALPGRFFLRRFVAWVAPELTGDPAHSRRFSEMMDDIDEARRAFAPRRMIAPMPFPDDAWATLAGKTLLLAGEAEVIFSAPAELARLARVAPGVESHLLPGAGHDFFVARADEVNARIVAHLSAPGA